MSFSPDGKRFVASRDLPAGWELVVMNTDGTGTASVIATRPRASPGIRLAVVVAVGRRTGRGRGRDRSARDPDDHSVHEARRHRARTLTPCGNPRPFLDQIAWTASDEALLATGGGSSSQILLDSDVRRPRGTDYERRPRLLRSLLLPGVRHHRHRADHAARVDLDWAGGSPGRRPGAAKPARRDWTALRVCRG